MITRKTHLTAVVLIPPEAVWEPIQRIRRLYDRQFHRWMPHVCLLYPFLPPEGLGSAAERLGRICGEVTPFEVSFSEVRAFHHSPSSGTIWLAPHPKERLTHLQAVLQEAYPDCDELSGFRDGFTPHLSLGQTRSAPALDSILGEVRASWTPLAFRVDRIALIRRQASKPFEVTHWIPIGATGPQG